MAQVPSNNDLHQRDSAGHDRRSNSSLNRFRRGLIRIVRSRWIAMFAISFAVSWSFHEVDEQQDRKHARQLRIVECTIQGVATEQAAWPGNRRVAVGPILELCIKQEDK